MFPERVRSGRRLLYVAIIFSLIVHLVGGSFWGWLLREVRHQPPPDDLAAHTEPITIERIPIATPRPLATPPPTPPPVQRIAQGRPRPVVAKHAVVPPPRPRARALPVTAQATLPPRAEPPPVRHATIHQPPAEKKVAVVPVPHGASGSAAASGAISPQKLASLDAMFSKTIAQAQHDVASAPQADQAAPVQTMKRYDRILQGSVDEIVGGEGICDPMDEGTVRGPYTYYYLSCSFTYTDGFSERVQFPWPFHFTRQDDPFGRRDGHTHRFPVQPPPPDYTLPHPFAMSRVVCSFYHDECAAIVRKERADGSLPSGD